MKSEKAPEVPRGYHHGDLRRSLVEAATALIERRGLEGLTLRAVARRAKVSHAAPYHHFASRDQLLEAVAAAGFENLRAFVVHHLEEARVEPAAMLQEAAVGYVLFAVENPDLYRVMFGAALKDHNPSAALLQSSADAYDLIHSGIAAAFCGRATGETIDDARVAVLARACWAMVHGVASLAIDGHLAPAATETAGEQARALTTVLWRGLHEG